MRKLKSKWTELFLITQDFSHVEIELENKEGVRFRVNRQHIKIYLRHAEKVNEVVEEYNIDEVEVIKSPASRRDVKSSVDWEATQYISSSQ